MSWNWDEAEFKPELKLSLIPQLIALPTVFVHWYCIKSTLATGHIVNSLLYALRGRTPIQVLPVPNAHTKDVQESRKPFQTFLYQCFITECGVHIGSSIYGLNVCKCLGTYVSGTSYNESIYTTIGDRKYILVYTLFICKPGNCTPSNYAMQKTMQLIEFQYFKPLWQRKLFGFFLPRQ